MAEAVPMAKVTGHRWRVIFPDDDIAFRFRNITPPSPSFENVDVTDLDDTFVDKRPGDVIDLQQLTFEAYFDGTQDPLEVVDGEVKDIDMIFGPNEAGTTMWKLRGYVREYSPQSATFNQGAMVQVTVEVTDLEVTEVGAAS